MGVYTSKQYIDLVIEHLKSQNIWDESSRRAVEYTLYHKVAFLHTYKYIISKIECDELVYTHDVDKLVLYQFMSKSEASKVHRSYSSHHFPNTNTPKLVISSIVDYECARITKPDKPLNAYETIKNFTPEAYELYDEYLTSFGINSSKRIRLPESFRYTLSEEEFNRLVGSTNNAIDQILFYAQAHNPPAYTKLNIIQAVKLWDKSLQV